MCKKKMDRALLPIEIKIHFMKKEKESLRAILYCFSTNAHEYIHTYTHINWMKSTFFAKYKTKIKNR